ncbi:MAG: DUF1049 domain-containing protein [Candidatus Omnitrophica bacterium]|nr:DUF1049 domain-containing protein [Candidatus Omnitrophota bacterium]
MNWKLAFTLILLVLVMIFIAQNHQTTTVKFLIWSIQSSKAVVLFLTLIMGAVIGSIGAVMAMRKGKAGSG